MVFSSGSHTFRLLCAVALFRQSWFLKKSSELGSSALCTYSNAGSVLHSFCVVRVKVSARCQQEQTVLQPSACGMYSDVGVIVTS